MAIKKDMTETRKRLECISHEPILNTHLHRNNALSSTCTSLYIFAKVGTLFFKPSQSSIRYTI